MKKNCGYSLSFLIGLMESVAIEVADIGITNIGLGDGGVGIKFTMEDGTTYNIPLTASNLS